MSDETKFKKKHPKLFGIESSLQHEIEHTKGGSRIYKSPSLSQYSDREMKVQEALLTYKGCLKTKLMLELYYEGHSLRYIKQKVGSKVKNFRSTIQKAKKKVLRYHEKVVMAPLKSSDVSVIRTLQLSYGDQMKSVHLIVDKRDGQTFWVTEALVALPEEVQDLLDLDDKYKEWDYVNIKTPPR